MTSNGTTSQEEAMEPDLVMMTPLKKELDHTVLRVERVSKASAALNGSDGSGSRHVAGGQHQGIIINKQVQQDSPSHLRGPFDLRLSFKVFLVNSITQIHQQESRELRFWFHNEGLTGADSYNCAQAFFRALVNPVDFPKNYVGFIMKLMKTMQQVAYRPLVQIELEVRALDEPFERPASSRASKSNEEPSSGLPDVVPKYGGSVRGPPPPIPPKPKRTISLDHQVSSQRKRSLRLRPTVSTEEGFTAHLLTEEKVLEMIESAYPNPLSLPDIAASTCSKEEEVAELVSDLVAKGVARLTDLGQVVRVTSDEREVKRVRQMPEVVRSQAPTVAIITAQFCEKLAVDAMIDNKDTYVRYKGEGESNVYTLGNIGPHRVVATKLPAVGNSRSAMIAAGNTTTRLLGTFQHVEYVFLVGIGGGVPHYTDASQHVRLGDIVVSTSPRRSNLNSLIDGDQDQCQFESTRGDYVYVHCEKLRSSPDEPLNASNSLWKEMQTVDSFNYRFWCPPSLELQAIAQILLREAYENGNRPWEKYLEEACARLRESDDLDFVRPPPATDKLYMSIGPNDVIEMTHPEPEENNTCEYDPRAVGMPKVHFGAIGSGRSAVGNEQLRQDIALKYGIKAFDIEFDTVIESIFGNRKDRYVIIRGVADYKDGSRRKEWQPYAALASAAFMKSILCRLEPVEHLA